MPAYRRPELVGSQNRRTLRSPKNAAARAAMKVIFMMDEPSMAVCLGRLQPFARVRRLALQRVKMTGLAHSWFGQLAEVLHPATL